MNTLSSLLNFIGGVIADYQGAKPKIGSITVKKSAVSSLPITITSSKIRADHKAKNLYLSNPSAMTGDWTFTPSDGSITISGTINGTTDIEFDLEVEVDTIIG